MIALQVGSVWPQHVKGILSMEGWTSHHVVPEAFDGDIDNTCSAQERAKNEAFRRRVMRRWSEAQIEEFRAYWRKWDGYEFLCTTNLPVLELYGDRGREKPSLDKLRIPQRDNIKVQWLENASHNLHIECPREVARACADFIRRG